MIKPVGQGLNAAVEAAKLRETAQARTAAPAPQSPAPAVAAEAVATPSARMAAQGAPIDSARIERVKQAIASGKYPVDPDKIAEKMLDLDLPVLSTRH
ncbi:MAG: flagellar biosynthesis anti-sigma factor FlgM [Sphingobium sp.]|nr:flagellar biosynthesis anti-sigma factor FlgM [Sphingobium sp.]